ncbi:hypothetical protein JB92DRAFT_2945023 [Gautieria morchelliformis]|nr:hypothetical protein JB92DRAFT_2945023 [Gautieria morchelliformis]
MPVETWEALESEERQLVEDNIAMSDDIKGLTSRTRTCGNSLHCFGITPTNEELDGLLREADQTLFSLHQQRQTPPVWSDLAYLDAEWQKWRALGSPPIATDAMVPQQCQDLDEDLEIEYDTPNITTSKIVPCANRV